MQIGMIGLGKMGGNMARRLRRGGVTVVAYNRNHSVTEALATECGVQVSRSLQELVKALPAPRIIWLMLPAGDATQEHIDQLVPLLAPGDMLVDGGNAYYKDDMRRAAELTPKGIHYLDAGVSGGIWGLANGYAIMYGGPAAPAKQLEPFIKVLAPAADKGWLHCGPVGSGHFVKMVHNGIEYGMMQAFAEGFALMDGRKDFNLDLANIAEMWRHGSVVRSWLLDLTADFLKIDSKLTDVAPLVPDSGEGRWTAMEAIEQGLPAPVISLSLAMRFASQGQNDYPAKLMSMMRKGFGGHFVHSSGDAK